MTTTRPAPTLPPAALLAAALLAGCGGGGDAAAPPPPDVGAILTSAGVAGAWYFAGASDPELAEPLDSRLELDAAAGTLTRRHRSDGVGPDTWMQDHLAAVEGIEAAEVEAGVVGVTTRRLDAGGQPAGPAATQRLRLAAGELQLAAAAGPDPFAVHLRFTRTRPALAAEALLPARAAYAGPGYWPDRTTFQVATVRGPVTLSVGLPPGATQVARDSVARGVENLSIFMSHLVGWFGGYPAATLYVDVDLPTPEATGAPGAIHIGSSDPALGRFGIDDPWLLGHELTHSYFSSQGMYSWMAEGMATFLPVVMRYDAVQTGQPPWFGPSRVSGDPADEAGLRALIQASAVDAMAPLLAARGLSLDTPLPQVEADYAAGSDLGRAFFATLYLKLGRQAFFRAFRDVYAFHRNDTRDVPLVTYQDLHDLVLAQTPAGRRAEVEPWLRARLGLP